MNLKEMREKDEAALKAHEGELRKELFNLRFQGVVGSLADPSRVGKVRREIAQVLTVLNQQNAQKADA
jgi:large subunit ribosomal protein L29